MAAHYAPRAVVVASDGGIWRGRAAIEALFAEVFEAGMRELRIGVGPRRRGPEGVWLGGSFSLALADGREGARGRWRAAAAPRGWRGGAPTEQWDVATAAERGDAAWLIRRHVFTIHEARVPLTRWQAVHAQVARIAALLNRGAVDAAARLYGEDVVLHDADGATYLGRGGAFSVLAEPLARGYRDLEVRVGEAVVVGDDARVSARFRWSRRDPPTRVEGDVRLHLRRSQGVWRVERQVVTGVRRG